VDSLANQIKLMAHVLRLRLKKHPGKTWRAYTEAENPEYLLTMNVSRVESKIPIRKFIVDLKFKNKIPGKIHKGSFSRFEHDKEHRSQLTAKCDMKAYRFLLSKADKRRNVTLRMGFRKFICRISFPKAEAALKKVEREKDIADRKALRSKEAEAKVREKVATDNVVDNIETLAIGKGVDHQADAPDQHMEEDPDKTISNVE
jgi:hypothetical protein